MLDILEVPISVRSEDYRILNQYECLDSSFVLAMDPYGIYGIFELDTGFGGRVVFYKRRIREKQCQENGTLSFLDIQWIKIATRYAEIENSPF